MRNKDIYENFSSLPTLDSFTSRICIVGDLCSEMQVRVVLWREFQRSVVPSNTQCGTLFADTFDIIRCGDHNIVASVSGIFGLSLSEYVSNWLTYSDAANSCKGEIIGIVLCCDNETSPTNRIIPGTPHDFTKAPECLPRQLPHFKDTNSDFRKWLNELSESLNQNNH